MPDTRHAFARRRGQGLLAALLLLMSAATLAAEPAGIVKVVAGDVSLERAGTRLAVAPGDPVLAADVLVTGSNGRCGVTFRDNSLLSLGPDSRLVIDSFSFDSTTHGGGFESTLRQGKLAVVSGKLAKHGKDQMKIRTPTSLLGVRGTEFVVEAAAPR